MILNKNNDIIKWNQSANRFFSIKSTSKKHQPITDLKMLKKNRINEGSAHSQKTQTPTTIKSINLKDKKGNNTLMNISIIPMKNQQNEFIGSMIKFNDITDIATNQTEITRLKNEKQELSNILQKTRNELHLIRQSNLKPSNIQKETEPDRQMICGDKSIISDINVGVNESIASDQISKTPENDIDISEDNNKLRTKIITDE